MPWAMFYTHPSGGVAEESGLQCGDELLEVQGTNLQDMTRFEAWNIIKALPQEPITAVIRRRADAEWPATRSFYCTSSELQMEHGSRGDKCCTCFPMTSCLDNQPKIEAIGVTRYSRQGSGGVSCTAGWFRWFSFSSATPATLSGTLLALVSISVSLQLHKAQNIKIFFFSTKCINIKSYVR